MSAGDLAAIVVSVAAFACFAVLLVAVMVLMRTLGELRETIAELRAEALPMMGELRETVADAGAEVDRVDGLLEAAETISARVDSASRLGYLAFRAPLIRLVAVVKGLGRGVRRLFGGPTRQARRERRANRASVRAAAGAGEQNRAA